MANNTTAPTYNDILVGWQQSPNSRGTWNIIWTCLQTMALCAWVSVRTNVPAPRQNSHKGWKEWNMFVDKFFFILLTLLGPELVVLLAHGQYTSARTSVEDFHSLGYEDWTIVHAFFADMGGIHVRPPDWKSFPVDAKQLHYLIKRNYLTYPKIDVDQIEDLSKADTAARFITLVQAFAFFATTIARFVQGLAVSTLELTVLANIFCTVVTMCWWWYKPTGVSSRFIFDLNTPINNIVQDAGIHEDGEYRDTPLDFVSRKEWIISLLWNYYVNILRRLSLLKLFDRADERPLQRIPSIKWLQPTSRANALVTAAIGTIYFCIFVGAWNFYFPSQTEQYMWRAVVLVQGSLILSATLFAWHQIVWTPDSEAQASDTEMDSDVAVPSIHQQGKLTSTGKLHNLWNRSCNNDLTGNFHCQDVPLRHLVVLTPIYAVYCVCRLIILTEDVVGLRALPASAFVQASWSVYWPWF